MVFMVSNSQRRALKTYARRPLRVFTTEDEENGMLPRKRIRMDPAGFAVEDLVTDDGPREARAEVPRAATETEHPTPPQTSANESLLSSPLSSPPTSPSPTSSPGNIFSDRPFASPPSSPPPTSTQRAAFSFLKRTSGPLHPVTANRARRVPGPAAKPRTLTQLQLDLGPTPRATCAGCGMAYVRSLPQDVLLHRKYHDKQTRIPARGMDMGKAFSGDPHVRVVAEGTRGGEKVVITDAGCHAGVRRKTETMLEVMAEQLGAIEIPSDELWIFKIREKERATGGVKASRGSKRKRGSDGDEATAEPRYKIFLYLKEDCCIGLCLAERILDPTKVVSIPPASSPAASSSSTANPTATGLPVDPVAAPTSTSSADDSHPVPQLGIARIWIASEHRRRGVALALLDAVRGNFFYGVEVAKECIAFSQPTAAGGALAKRWGAEGVYGG